MFLVHGSSCRDAWLLLSVAEICQARLVNISEYC